MKEDIGYKAVEAIVDRNIESEVNWDGISEIGLLGIDEISLKKGYKDFITLITSRSEKGTRIICLIKCHTSVILGQLSGNNISYTVPRVIVKCGVCKK